MQESVSINSILNAAVEREQEAYRFYKDVAERVSNQAVKDAFQELAGNELGHRDFLKNCLKDPGLLKKLPVPKDYKVAEATESLLISVDMEPACATIAEAAQELGLSLRTVNRYCLQGMLGGARFERGLWLVPRPIKLLL